MITESFSATPPKRNSKPVPPAGKESVVNPKVSQVSYLLDEIWDFSQEFKSPSRHQSDKRLRWGFRIKVNESFTDPKYYSIRTASRQLFHALLRDTEEGPAQKPSSVLLRWGRIKTFIIYLATRPRPILSYDEVTPALMSRYINHLKKTHRSSGNLYSHFRSLTLIFLYRRKMCNSLRFDPFATSSAGVEAGYNRHYQEQHKTDYIPDRILKDLISAAMEYVTIWGPVILSASAKADKVRRKFPGSTNTGVIRYHIRKTLSGFNQRLSDTATSQIRPLLSNLNELHQARILLRTACGILIAFVTGMRLSELLSLKAGCVEIETTGDGEFIWLHSTLFKMQRASEGRSARWLGGPVAHRAVAMLTKLTKEIRTESRCPYLVVPVTPIASKKWNRKLPISDAFDHSLLHDFSEFVGLKDEQGRSYHIHPHMFRRTFARHVVRSDTTNLMALKEHFKHCSVAMTDGYVGIDEELQDHLDSENDLLGLDSFDKALRSTQLSGRRGKELVAMVDKAIGEGRLPVEFRGEAGRHFRKKMIHEFVDAGQQLYPCGASNFCWFRKDFADCTEGTSPVIEICNPIGCANSVINREEHGAYWQAIVNEGENLLAMKPKGPYKARLVSITRIAKKVVSDLG